MINHKEQSIVFAAQQAAYCATLLKLPPDIFNKIHDAHNLLADAFLAIAALEEEAEAAPAAPEIVYCKECLFWHDGGGYCRNASGMCLASRSGFCSAGERRESNE